MKNIAFLLIIASVFNFSSVYAQAQNEDQLYTKIQKTQNNDDIIEYVVDFPQGAQIQEVEKILFKKCVKNQKEKDCEAYLDLFSEEGQYVDSVMGILDRILEEKAERGEENEIFKLPSFQELIQAGTFVAEALDKDKKPIPTKLPFPKVPAKANVPKTYAVNLTFGASNVAKVYLNNNLVTLKQGPKGKAYYGSLKAGDYELKVMNTSGQVSCLKLLKVTKAVTIVNPCLSLPNYSKK